MVQKKGFAFHSLDFTFMTLQGASDELILNNKDDKSDGWRLFILDISVMIFLN